MVINRTVCAGFGGLALGIALGIGFGALIWDRPWKHGNVGGGIWFGKKRRRKREVERNQNEILANLEEGETKYTTNVL